MGSRRKVASRAAVAAWREDERTVEESGLLVVEAALARLKDLHDGERLLQHLAYIGAVYSLSLSYVDLDVPDESYRHPPDAAEVERRSAWLVAECVVTLRGVNRNAHATCGGEPFTREDVLARLKWFADRVKCADFLFTDGSLYGPNVDMQRGADPEVIRLLGADHNVSNEVSS